MEFVTTVITKEDGTFGTEVHFPVVRELSGTVCIVLHCSEYFLFDRTLRVIIPCPLSETFALGKTQIFTHHV